MTLKRLSDFGLSLALSLSSLLVIAVPKAYAGTSPDAMSQEFMGTNIVTIVSALSCIGMMLLITKKYNRTSAHQ